MSTLPVLIVDDEPDICELLELTLSRLNLQSHSANNLTKAIELLKENQYSLCLTDMRLPDGDGLDLVSHIARYSASTPVAVITAHGSMDSAIDALKRGAFDFLNKPIELDNLKSIVIAATDLPNTVNNDALDNIESRLIGKSAAADTLRNNLLKVARSQAPVFIQGESGTGKEVCARIIHENSARNKGPFLAVNCGAIPSELVESEFFGHKKGSFTGATSDHPGLFLSANGGTLLLDEVADLPLTMQVKLLRTIQEKTVRAVGSNSETPVDVRIISATHKNLSQLVHDNLFRSDLYYRINVIEIIVPPLRERTEDIQAIANFILQRISNDQSIQVPKLSKSAIEKLCTHDYPGNIRELENTLERTVAFSESNEINDENIEFQRFNTSSPSNEKTVNDLPLSKPSPEQSSDSVRHQHISLDDYLQNIEKEEILHALTQCRWNKTETAQYLGISFRSLRYRLKKLGLEE